jgi:hypothetical protein
MAVNCDNTLGSIWPDDVYFVVGVANPSVNNGTAVQIGDVSFIIPSFVGWKVRLVRALTPQYLTNPGTGNIYFDYTSITGEFTLSSPASLNEEYIAMAYKPVS